MALILFSILILVIGIFLYNLRKKTEENTTPFNKIKKKLKDDLQYSKFSGDWEKTQKINLQLIWLETIYIVESRNIYELNSEFNTSKILDSLSIEDIKFPTQWKQDDYYCFPFAQEIMSACGKIFAENEYKGLYKPDSLLPVPKEYIRKSIFYLMDYLNLEKPHYKVQDKDNFANTLNEVNSLLYYTFINTANNVLPKTGFENISVGNKIKETQLEHDEIDDFKLIDWRSEMDWIGKGIYYGDEKLYDHAFACYEQANKINPDSSNVKLISALTYLTIGEEHFAKGEMELAIENMKKSAELNDKTAINWLALHNSW